MVNKFRDYSNRLRGTNSIDRTIDLSQTAFTSDIEDLNRSAALHPDNDTPLPLDKKEVVAAPPTGYMFGKGIYLADMSSKSASYCYPGDSGGEALLLLCEAELGNPCQMLKDADCNAAEKAKKQGMYTTQGLGLIGPNKWMDAGAIHQYLEGVKMVSHIRSSCVESYVSICLYSTR